ncbi:metal dependent phosphohydrolase [Methanocaldococcus infernus ME]|uniref:Metal dependent phosphohydrolase n=1 Tax=Methanocaldococcus infernus (strain DSM 11812 / JCM 15783 / ME) TaxID=573063 RepID=D5VR55_METIM|nr:HD domain-containing protein [Methanocaldococcus infernus]ADG13058.1 metal dependent phosphohydrolase [Methanocaldococcus infernus ME]
MEELKKLNGVAKEIFNELENNVKVNTLLKMSNIMAVKRLGYNDHGKTHARIVANNAIKILKILNKRNIVPSYVKECKGSFEDSLVITLVGAYLHDIGNSVHRKEHHLHSAYLAKDIVEEILKKYYSEEKAYQMLTEILHAIYSHSEGIPSITVEAGCIAVADGTDMTKGRSRIPICRKCYDIHSISAASVEKVTILEGKDRPIKIEVILSNEAGIFQIQEVLGEKINWSGLKDYISVYAKVEKESPVFKEITL